MKRMKKIKRYVIIFVVILICITSCRKSDTVVRLAVTTDVHGMIFPYDFTDRNQSDHSLSHIYNYVTLNQNREDTLFFLLDNGDFLQGQPTVYYYNFIDTESVHLAARVMNFMAYSAGTVGNHDIEAGPEVYNRVREELDFPWLAANVVNPESGQPYFEPYTILKANGRRIAVFGLTTPGIPYWLPKTLWPEMEFHDMVETARKWVPILLKKEKPDLLVGLFHSGTDASYGGNPEPYLNENAVLHVAEEVPGFDVIFAGHDHRVSIQWIVNHKGDSVLVVDPGSHARYAGEVTIAFGPKGTRHISAQNVPMAEYGPSPGFEKAFAMEREALTRYLRDTITWLSETMDGVDALFGPSAMMSLIHQVQLELSGADLSFTAPLSLTAKLDKGPLLVSDMFKLYRFENMLYTMELSGKEVDGFLEHAAGLWFNTMTSPGDHFLQFKSDTPGRLNHPCYNFSSAAGIDYRVDVTKPPGERVNIMGFSNGNSFNPEEKYLVAINSYRGNGGGGHLTSGAGIPAGELAARIRWSTDVDLRFYLMQYLANQDTLDLPSLNNWKCVPAEWVSGASARDRNYFR
jgi:2',3'-cyclic-nucleotide 2'-phosphodiesterase/3'-nucleotidase